MNHTSPPSPAVFQDEDEISLLDLFVVIAENIKLLIAGPILAGLIAFGLTFAAPTTYTAKTSFAPPPQLNGSATKIMGYLSGDYLREEVAEKLNLQKRWGHDNLGKTRHALQENLAIKNDAKTGVITLEYADANPVIAAEIANQYVDALGARLANDAASDVNSKLTLIERQLAEASKAGRSAPMLKETVTAAIVQQIKGAKVADGETAFIQSAQITRFDAAKPPDAKNVPKRGLIAVVTVLATGFALLLFVFIREAFRNANHDPESAAKLQRIRRAFGR